MLQARWPVFEPFERPAEGDGQLFDFILGPDVFTHARVDLGAARVGLGAPRCIASRAQHPQRD